MENVCASPKGSPESCFQMLRVAVGLSCWKEGLRAGGQAAVVQALGRRARLCWWQRE